MEVTFTTTLDDLVALNLYLHRRSRAMRWRITLGWVLLPVACGLFAAAAFFAAAPPGVSIGLTLGGVLLIPLYPILMRLSVRRAIRAQLRERGGGFGRTTLVVSEKGVRVKTPVAETVARWEAMKEAVEDGGRTYIFLTGNAAAVIPRREFETGADYEAVRDFALAKLCRAA